MPHSVNLDPEPDDTEEYPEEDAEEPGFQRIRRSTGKTPTIKDDRRQQRKEWGRMHSKFSKQRKKAGERQKP